MNGAGTLHRQRSLRGSGCSSLSSRVLLITAGVALLQTAQSAWALPSDGNEIPQPTRVERFNPDQQACLPPAIRNGFANQLLPFADQPPAVLEQLRRVQHEMTRATLQRCVSKGLLQPAQASELERELGLQSGPASAPAAGPTSPPAGAGSAAPPARP